MQSKFSQFCLAGWIGLLSVLGSYGAEQVDDGDGMNSFTNRLVHEKSPYLLQHANNPVDWFPWGDEAFEKAKKEDKPIFLSIGYATCHWCHVMEHESFENEEVAKLMNDAFVCIKVDREERPDIDNIYMSVCQMMTQSGGWPLTIVMTPEKKPFFAATYIPAENRYGRSGMVELIPRLQHAWTNQRDEVLKSANQITSVLLNHNENSRGEIIGTNVLHTGYAQLMDSYDKKYGGFRGAPKFPTPHQLIFLLRTEEESALQAVEHTLEEMRKGGIYDQIGFGFHRYSTDEEWLVPHFEKMLYDQAMLTLAYTEAYERTKKPMYAKVVDEIITYVTRDMTAPEGGFYSAEDADSEGEEGLFYLWKTEEFKSVLSSNDYEFIEKVWNLKDNGNYNDEATRKKNGRNIPHLSRWLNDEESMRLEKIREQLFQLRKKRIHPLKDTKVLADWNGLMIAAMAKAARVFNKNEYLKTAEKANHFIETSMCKKDGQLWHRWRENETLVDGQFEDYVFMIFGLLELYDATFKLEYLETALKYNQILEKKFIDPKNGGYFMTAKDAEELIIRPKSYYDGAIPSGNSMHMLNLFTLARLTGRTEFEQRALTIGQSFSSQIERAPSAYSQALVALDLANSETMEMVIVGKKDQEETEAMLNLIKEYQTFSTMILFKEPSESDRLQVIAPFTEHHRMIDDKPTVYICKNFVCEQPINSIDELRLKLQTK